MEISRELRTEGEEPSARNLWAESEVEVPEEEQDDLYRAVASTFASARSHQLSSQETKAEASPIRTQFPLRPLPRHSPIPDHPILLSEFPRIARTPPTLHDEVRLHRSLTQRDLAVLQALYDLRYLTTAQIRDLFFPSIRSAQIRIQALHDLGVLYRWKVIERPGFTRRHSLLILSPRGATILAHVHGDRPHAYVEASRQATAYSWRASHDVAANDFFVWLALEARRRHGLGLIYWVGEAALRARYQGSSSRPYPAPDGQGGLLVPEGHVRFDLEWDRGTETLSRLEKKLGASVDYYGHIREGELHNILVLVPSDRRERLVREAAADLRPDGFVPGPSCNIWTATHRRLRALGPLGVIWSSARRAQPRDHDRTGGSAAEPPDRDRSGPTSIDRMPAHTPDPDIALESSIGAPEWWLRRPAGAGILP